jgi:hypothetical protein
LARSAVEHACKAGQLFPAGAARRNQRRRGHGRIEADQGDAVEAPNEGELGGARGAQQRRALGIGAHVIEPAPRAEIATSSRIDVMVARNDADAVGRPEALEPGQRVDVLLRQANIGKIARDHDVVGSLRLQVGNEPVEHAALMVGLARAAPVPIAAQPLQVPIAWREATDRAEVDVGEVSDGERSVHR